MSSNGFTFIATLLALTTSAFASEEVKDRIVDEASVEMQNEADRDLSALVAKYRGTKREAEMLLRLAELRLEIADGLFRVAYGPTEGRLKTAYRKKLASGITPLSRILSAYPRSEGAPRALFLRGKALKELGKNAQALKDLEGFLAKYSSREEAPLAAIGIADLSIAKQDYRRVISVLKTVLAKPEHPLYPNALAKRAWALQAEGHSAAAVSELEKLAKFFTSRDAENRLSAGDRALRDSVLSDIPSITYLAYRDNPRKFSLTKLNALLRSFDTGEGYRRMAIKIADALRAADLNSQLRSWKAIVLKSDPSKKENLPMLVTILEYDLDRESYFDVVKTSADVADIVSKNPEVEEAETARKLVVTAVDRLTKRLTDYRKSAKANQAEKFLASLLPTFDRMTSAEDPRRFAMRWNMAETYFSLDRFESATANYRWIYENWNEKAGAAMSKVTTRMGVALKAISSRYETLRAKKLIPENLIATASISKPLRNASKIALIREWLGWVDTYARETNDSSQSLHYSFEGYRALYQAGFQDEALALMKRLAMSHPSSKFAIPSASLVVDTWIARKRWDQVEEESKVFAKTFAQNKLYSQKMATQAASAKFKQAEIAYASKNYKQAIEHAKEFVSSYRHTNLAIDASAMVCNAYLAANQSSAAVDCFADFSKDYAGTKAAKQALRSAARLEDEQFHYASAADLYSRYLSMAKKSDLSAKENLAIRKRILLLSRATGDVERMERASKNRAICAPKLQSVCDLNLAIVALQRGSSNTKTTEWALRQSKSAKKDLRSIYAMIAIEGLSENGQWRSLNSSSIDRATRALTSNWKHTDPAVRYFLIAKATKYFPSILERDRKVLKQLEVDATEKTITRRLRALNAFENRVDLISDVPVNAIRATASKTLFAAYNDMISDMREIPPPAKATKAQLAEHRNLVAALANPFVLKSRKIRDASKSLEIAERRGLDTDMVGAIWSRSGMKGSGEMLRREWAKAVSDENWSRVAFLSDEASELKEIPSSWSKAARAASLAEAGAASEAKAVFGDACRDSSGAPSVREACRIVAKKGRG